VFYLQRIALNESKENIFSPLSSEREGVFYLRGKMLVKAYTLVEVLVAGAIILICVAGLLFLFVTCRFLNDSNSNLVTAASDAQTVLEQIKDLSYLQIGSYTPPQFNHLPEENVTLTTSSQNRLTEVTVNVSWTERGQERTFTLKTYFSP